MQRSCRSGGICAPRRAGQLQALCSACHWGGRRVLPRPRRAAWLLLNPPHAPHLLPRIGTAPHPPRPFSTADLAAAAATTAAQTPRLLLHEASTWQGVVIGSALAAPRGPGGARFAGQGAMAAMAAMAVGIIAATCALCKSACAASADGALCEFCMPHGDPCPFCMSKDTRAPTINVTCSGHHEQRRQRWEWHRQVAGVVHCAGTVELPLATAAVA